MIYLISFFEAFAAGLLGINLALYLSKTLGLPPTPTGQILFTLSIVSGVCLFLFSSFIDKHGIKKSILVGTVLLGISRLLLGITPSIYVLPLALLMAAIGSSIKSSSLLVYIKQHNLSFKLDYIVFNLAFMLSGIVYDEIKSPDKIYLIAAALTMVNLVLVPFLKPTIRSPHHKLPPYKLSVALSVLHYNLVMLPVTCIFSFLSNPFPTIVLRTFGPDAPIGKIYGSLNPFIILFTVPLVVLIVNRYKFHNVVKVAQFGTLVSALSLFLVFLPIGGYAPIIAAVCLFTVGEAIWSPSSMEIGAKRCPAGAEGRYMALALLPRVISGSLMSMYAAYTLNHIPGYTSFAYMGVLALLTPVLLYWIKIKE